jgi:hypothetical protein
MMSSTIRVLLLGSTFVILKSFPQLSHFSTFAIASFVIGFSFFWFPDPFLPFFPRFFFFLFHHCLLLFAPNSACFELGLLLCLFTSPTFDLVKADSFALS